MLKRVLCPQLPRPDRPATLPETEAHHVTRVLRLRDGDKVEAMDGKGGSVEAVLRVKHGPARLEWAGVSTNALHGGGDSGQELAPVILEMAILKGDAMEWVVEKAVELGCSRLVPVTTAHTVVQIKSKGPEAFRERWQKIADQALKQCGRLQRMEVELPVSLEELLARSPAQSSEPRLWFDEAARAQAGELSGLLHDWRASARLGREVAGARLLVGPEGGWSETERTLLQATSHVLSASLGPLVLRAETAAIASLGLVTSAFRAAKSTLDKNTRTKGS